MYSLHNTNPHSTPHYISHACQVFAKAHKNAIKMQHHFWSVEHVQIIPSWCLESQLTTEMARTEITTISNFTMITESQTYTCESVAK